MNRSTFAPSLLALVVLSGAACGGREPPTVVAPPSPVAAVVTPTATAKPAASPDDPKANLVALVCSKREGPCELVREHSAGRDAKGRDLSVALFFVGGPEDETGGGTAAGAAPSAPAGDADDDAALERARRGPLSPEERDPGLHLDRSGERFSMSQPGSCFAYEYWRTVREDGNIVEGDKIAAICNDGNGAAGVGEDEVTVGRNEVTIRTSGGSSWRWENTTSYSLVPWSRRTERSSSSWTLAAHRTESWVDFVTLFRGGTWWATPRCDASGQMIDEVVEVPEHAYEWAPIVTLDPAFVAGGWRTTFLHECAVSIDAAGARGHVVMGAEGEPEDATVKVVAASSSELFVEVIDDVVTGPTGRAASDDHLEVWTAPALPEWDSRCIDPKDTKGVVAWDVRVADGKVTAGFGKPQVKSLVVERAADPDGTVRFKLGLPAGMGAVTIAYADSDAGGKIERRIATSALDGGRVATLGKLGGAADHVRCAAQNGGLVRELLPEKLPAP